MAISPDSSDVYWDPFPPYTEEITNTSSYYTVLEYVTLQYPVIFSILAIAILYFLWYTFKIVHQPLIYGGKDGLQEYLLTHCPVLSELYRPTFWAWHYHLNTVLRALMQHCIPISYKRQIIVLPDGGTVALDWAKYPINNINSPVLLIIPGLTGNSKENYILHYVNDGFLNGCHSVVFNQRGLANVPITTPLIVAISDNDINAVLDVIQEQHPNSPIIGIGTSLGGIILTKYLHSAGEQSRISACLSISPLWDLEESAISLEQKWINKKIYVDHSLNSLKEVVKRNSEVLAQNSLVNIQKILQVSNISEFNKELIVPTYGFDSVYHYHRQGSVNDQLSNIKVPYLSVMSMDDPFAPFHSIPISEFERNPNTVLLLTRYGGHFGFIEGAWPRGHSWMNRVLRQCLAAIIKLQ